MDTAEAKKKFSQEISEYAQEGSSVIFASFKGGQVKLCTFGNDLELSMLANQLNYKVCNDLFEKSFKTSPPAGSVLDADSFFV